MYDSLEPMFYAWAHPDDESAQLNCAKYGFLFGMVSQTLFNYMVGNEKFMGTVDNYSMRKGDRTF